MTKVFIFTLVLFLSITSIAHNKITTPTLLVADTTCSVSNNNELNSLLVSINSTTNRIYFSTPLVIEHLNISIKDRSNRIVLQQNNIKISKDYSISFPSNKSNDQYTIIVQKDNHILVEHLPKRIVL